MKNNLARTFRMNNFRQYYGLASIFTLLAGFTTYLLFRNVNNMVIFSMIPKPAFLETVLVPLEPSILSAFLRYHLPDMLWFASGILLFRFIWFNSIKMQRLYILCFYITGFVIETSQMSDNIPGTFDWLDLLFMGITAFVEYFLYKKLFLRRFK